MEQATRLGHPRLSDYLERAWREGALWALVIVALYLVLALASYSPDDPGWSFAAQDTAVQNAGGRLGAWFADLALFLVGGFAYLIPIALVWSAYLLFREHESEPETKLYWLVLRWIGLAFTIVAGAGLASLQFAGSFGELPNGLGGGLGLLVATLVDHAFGLAGGSLVLLGVLLIGLSLFTGLSPLLIVDGIGDLTLMLLRLPPRLIHHLKAQYLQRDRGFDDQDWEYPQDRSQGRAQSSSEPDQEVGDWLTYDDIGLPETPRTHDLSAWTPSHVDSGVNAVSAGNYLEAPAPGELDPRRLGIESDPAATPEPGHAASFSTSPAVPNPTAPNPTAPDPTAPDPGESEQPPVAHEQNAAHQATARTEGPSPAAVEPVWADAPAAARTKPTSAHPATTTAHRSTAGTAPSERPPLDLLDPPRRSGNAVTPEQLETMSRELEARLAEFGVVAEVVEVHPGPVVALFELELAPGVKVSKITGLSKDIARALSKISVRVVEVIPGKSVIGLEVPNNQREMVTLSEILGSRTYQEAKSPLTIGMGTNISGEPVVADLARMPHALIAGTTGSGKSVAINAMILSLVYKAPPEDVRLIMVDPKMLELSVYEGIPHLLTPVVTDMKEAANALRWCVGEMERRYKLMASLGVRNLAGYNRKVQDAIAAGQPITDPSYAAIVNAAIAEGEEPPEVPILEKLPTIVVIIDELADMMMVVGKKVEELIARLAQKARASGIHLLLATQRPSVDVLTGLIKANIPTRMAFKVSARVDSRTVLDQMGAEHLLGHGDMLYLPPGGSISQRVHGAFVDDHEVHRVVDFLKQQGEPDYIETILQEPSEHLPGIDPEPKGGGDVEDQDPLFDEAVQIVVESRRASISGVQRRLKIGYNRAARMIEEMERIGIVGSAESNGNREVLAPPPPQD
ncbi:DNA translocase FtsK [Halochromatium glycolicum]|uniref:DNA translocase FtsK n=1 Tax=Halochromatium glycolicum TaxID=85075 RepID=A0AAJ0X9U0_9GAMM|nr:DNA translocase FtsK [Halochromatium glycolicum]MBK1705139.1 cell division protein FtsK [Halochromatium glycolicum]